jgi:ceramide glucosyltransferase
VTDWFPILLTAIVMVGVLYTLAGAALAGRWRDDDVPDVPFDVPSITMLKPLHGPEPALERKLAGFLRQDYPAPIDMVCGVASDTDPACDAARAVQAELVVSGRSHGSNGKVSNLINMAPHAKGALLVLSDSDMIVPRDYAARIALALRRPNVGAVTLLYAGHGDAGPWSQFAAAGISWGFLPSVMVGLATGLAKPCMGSTIALSAETLQKIGGFERFADLLADDHAIGAAVRALGHEVAVPPPILLHGCTETSLPAVIAHELRWNATVRQLDRAGYTGALVTYPFAWSLIAAAFGAGWWPIAVALAARAALAVRIDHVVGKRTAPLVWLPGRDLLSFSLHIAAFFTRRVDWRGSRLHMQTDGRLSAEPETR